MKKYFILGSSVFLIPSVLSAQELPSNIATLISNMNRFILSPIFYLLMSLAVLYFIWGLVQFLMSRGGGRFDTETGKNHMIWGIIGLFIMVSAIAIINIVLGTFGIDPLP